MTVSDPHSDRSPSGPNPPADQRSSGLKPDVIPPDAFPPDERGQRARDRVLLFVRGMDLPPLESVELARESLNRSGVDVSPAEAMRVLRDLLAEQGLAHSLQNSRGERQLSAPPMNRHPMIAEELDRKPWLTAIRRGFKRLGGLFRRRNARPGPGFKDSLHG